MCGYRGCMGCVKGFGGGMQSFRRVLLGFKVPLRLILYVFRFALGDLIRGVKGLYEGSAGLGKVAQVRVLGPGDVWF